MTFQFVSTRFCYLYIPSSFNCSMYTLYIYLLSIIIQIRRQIKTISVVHFFVLCDSRGVFPPDYRRIPSVTLSDGYNYVQPFWNLLFENIFNFLFFSTLLLVLDIHLTWLIWYCIPCDRGKRVRKRRVCDFPCSHSSLCNFFPCISDVGGKKRKVMNLKRQEVNPDIRKRHKLFSIFYPEWNRRM